MEGIYITEDELWALSRCSGIAVKAYLRLRSRMDLRTGIVGQRTGVSYKMVQEWAAQAVEKGAGEAEVMPTARQARTAVEQLERRGLLRKLKQPVGSRSLVFKCPMAEMPEVRAKRTRHERGSMETPEQGREQGTYRADLNASAGAGFKAIDYPEQGREHVTNATAQKQPNASDIGDGVNNYLSQAAYTEVEAERAREAIAALGLAKMSQASPPAMPESKRRVVDLVLSARQASVPVTSSDPRVIAWAAQGVTPRQLEQAIGIAKQRRAAEGSRQAINAGYLDAILRDILNPPERPAVAAAWWSSVAGMDAKARELGIATARPGETEADYKNRIRSALMRSAEGADGAVGVTA